MIKYIFKEQFDTFICDIGRVTINPNAECVLVDDNGTKKLFFVNTNNYLPYKALQSLLHYDKIHNGIDQYAKRVDNFLQCQLTDEEIKKNMLSTSCYGK